jgi:predicted nucleic acid-binding protein
VIVVDASAAVEILLNSNVAGTIEASLSAAGRGITPVHFDAEVYKALRRAYLRKGLDRSRLQRAVDRLQRFDAERVRLVPLLPNVVGLADVLGAHDVFYVLLAISRRCPLLTCDLGLARAATRLGVEVIAVDRSRRA